MSVMQKVLIVEDTRTNLALMDMLVREIEGCETVLFDNPADVLADLPQLDFDVALVDYQMPGLSGVELIERLRQCPRVADKPLVIVTADKDSRVRMKAIDAGAVDFLHKPIEPVEFTARLKNLLRLSHYQRELADRAKWLKSEVDKATMALRQREEEIIERLSIAAGYKDFETARHAARMARYSAEIARGLGLEEEFCQDLQLAAPMHDIGKVGIRDAVLLKRGLLTAEERAHITEHTEIGSAILSGSNSELLRMAAEIAASHHERWDGEGYPRRLRGTQIPLVGRICAVADVFDALTTERPYKAPWSLDRALVYLKAEAGRQFDPACIEAFELRLENITRIMVDFADDVCDGDRPALEASPVRLIGSSRPAAG